MNGTAAFPMMTVSITDMFNTTSSGDDLSVIIHHSWLRIGVSAAVVTAIMLVIVLGNALVVVAIARDRRHLGGLQNWFIASLAVADLLVGLFIMPMSLTNELVGYWVFGDVMCEIWLATDVLLCTASILNLVLISLDRYWSITQALIYVQRRTKNRVVAMIATVWLMSVAVSLPPLAGWKRPQPVNDHGFPLCVLSEEPGYVVYSTVGSFYVPLLIIIVVYSKIYLAARSRARRPINAAARSHTPTVRPSNNGDVGPATTTIKEHNATVNSNEIIRPLSIDCRPHSMSLSTTSSSMLSTFTNIRSTPVTPLQPPDNSFVSVATPTSVDWACSYDGVVDDVDDLIATADANVDVTSPSNVVDTLVSARSLRKIDEQIEGDVTVGCSSRASAPITITSLTIQSASVTRQGSSKTSTVPELGDIFQSAVNEHERRKRHLARARERRTTVVLGIVMVSFVGCWLPFFTIYPITLLLGVVIPDQLFAVIFWLGYCNSALNPIIYTIFNREFRSAFQRMLCRRRQAANRTVSLSRRASRNVY